MQKIILSTSSLSQAVSETCLILNKTGAVVALPTETVYGLVCRWDDKIAVERIYRMKARDAKKPLAMFASNIGVAQTYGASRCSAADKLAASFCPGPLTIIMANEHGGKIGLRIPDHPFVSALLNELGCPLASTSANLSGSRNALNAADAVAELALLPDLLVDGGNIPAGTLASTVVDVSGKEIQIFRLGPITELMLRQALRA